MKTALIIDVTSGPGAYLARLLQARGYRLWGTVAGEAADTTTLQDLGLGDVVGLLTSPPGDAEALQNLLDLAEADEIYDLGGEVGVETSIALIDALPALRRRTRLFYAATGGVFGDTGALLANETAPFLPASTGAAASADITERIVASRASGQFAVTGLVFDHASRFGPADGMTFQVIEAVAAIAAGGSPQPLFDRLERWASAGRRDCGWTPEYVDAMWRLLQLAEPRDMVVASGVGLTAHEVAGHALAWFGIELGLPAISDGAEVTSRGDPALASGMGWRAYTFGRDLVETLCEGLAAPR